MTMLPDRVAKRRTELAAKYLLGSGIEIGALDAPLAVPDNARVTYVDRVSSQRLREYYPELREHAIVEPDVIDDGETLATFADASLDFIVANHMLEHCENPLGTIRRHMRCLRPGGILFYSIPDKRFSFDKDRPITTIEHLLDDEKDGGLGSRKQHYREWAVDVNKIADPAAAEHNARENERNAYSIHFHVWDEEAFLELLRRLHETAGLQFGILHVERNDTEVVALLRKPD